MVTRRVIVNLVVFVVATTGLIFLGITQLLMQGGRGERILAEFTDAGGVLPRNDITMRGVTVGSVTDVWLTEDGTVVELALNPGIAVPEGTQATVVRRSPIGDVTIELTPGDGTAMAAGDTIPVEDTQPAPDAGRTVEVLAEVLASVPPEDISTVVTELADALRGRGDDLARLSRAGADLPERILTVRAELESLMQNGPDVTGTLAENADVLADDITRTAQLADILRDRRFDLVALYESGAEFTEVWSDFLSTEKANISCLISDFATINSTIAARENLRNLEQSLKLNHRFFGAVELAVQKGLDDREWFRVQLLPHQEPPGETYAPKRPAPNVHGGDACRSPFGRGVGRSDQPIPVQLAPESKLRRGR